MELMTVQSDDNSDARDFLNTAEYACLEETCRFATDSLDDDRQELSERVASRCVAIAEKMNLSGSELVRLEMAALVHRVGELFLDESLRRKSFLDMNPVEMQSYRHYPIFSALRVSQFVGKHFYEILLNHREYYAGSGFLDACRGEKIPVGARILCVATEYEEMLAYHGGDAIRQDTIQRRMMKNTIGRYDPKVLNALMLTIAEENVSH